MGDPLRTPVPSWWMILASFASAVFVGSVALGVGVYVRFALCEVVAAQVAVYAEAPPSTRTGQVAEGTWRDLEHRLFC